MQTTTNLDSNFSRAQIEHRNLLFQLKTVIDSIILNKKGSGGVFSGLQNLHSSIEKIFIHGIRIFKPDGSPDCWRFIEGLNWLNPSYTSISNVTPEKKVHVPFGRIKNDKSLEWIYRCLETNTLSHKLHYLLSDFEHLTNCYEVTAYLRNEKYTVALITLLKAIENNQPNLLTKIDSILYNPNQNNDTQQTHKRSSSHPNISYNKSNNINLRQSPEIRVTKHIERNKKMGNRSNTLLKIDYNFSESSTKDEQTFLEQQQQQQLQSDKELQKNVMKMNNHHKIKNKRINNFRIKEKKRNKKEQVDNVKIRSWNSLPNLLINNNLTDEIEIPLKSTHRIRSKTISQPIHIPSPYRRVHLTAELLALNDNKRVPSFTYKQQFPSDSGDSSGTQKNLTIPTNSSHSNTNSLTNQNNNDLTPITLLKCDDIKIHFDRKHTSRSILREDDNNRSPQTTSRATILTELPHTNANSNQTINESTSPNRRSLFSYLDNFDKGETSGNGSGNKTMSLFSTSVPTDFVNTFIPKSGEKLQTQQQFIQSTITDDSGNLSLPTTAGRGYFPRPTRGQSLASFLQIAQFSRTNTELDRENAHFSISEAMISAIEQLKWTHYEKYKLKQRQQQMDDRDKEKKRSHQKRLKNWDKDNVEATTKKAQTIGTTNIDISSPATTLTDCGSDDCSNSSNYESSDISSQSTDTSNELSYLKDLSVSMNSVNEHVEHAAYAEWGENTSEALSAEGVALSLISKFSDKQLPRASDLLWLVSEQEAPQELLPMPESWSVNPDEKYIINSFLRGTKDWAPPRAQIIFTQHPKPDRKKIMQLQNQRCAGCGMRVAPAYSHRFRYCEYIGKYHCTGCHRNQISSIPARVLQNWDFSCKPVSVFSYRLLNQIWTFPLFRICDLNPKLFTNIKALRISRYKRIQLKYIQDFILACRFSETLKNHFESLPTHLTTDVEVWAMSDFISIKQGTFNKEMNALIVKCDEHIVNCVLCTARGFICELCPKKQIIFPWQKNVKRCNNCGACYHELCWIDDCSKCERLRKRQQIN